MSRSPQCSACEALVLECRYAEGGRRGIPAAYIQSLEDRLAETEAALLTALAAIDSMHDEGTGMSQLLMEFPDPISRESSKIEKQDEWKRLPLQSAEQLQTWFKVKSRSDIHAHRQPIMRSSLHGHSQSTHREDLASDETVGVVGASVEPPSVDDAGTAHTPTNVPISTQLQDSQQWRNYF